MKIFSLGSPSSRFRRNSSFGGRYRGVSEENHLFCVRNDTVLEENRLLGVVIEGFWKKIIFFVCVMTRLFQMRMSSGDRSGLFGDKAFDEGAADAIFKHEDLASCEALRELLGELRGGGLFVLGD